MKIKVEMTIETDVDIDYIKEYKNYLQEKISDEVVQIFEKRACCHSESVSCAISKFKCF